MLKNLFLATILAVTPLASVSALNPADEIQDRSVVTVVYAPTQLLEFYDYAGDQYGDFVGDLVARLTDGSEWKIHPDHRNKFLRWGEGDIIHISARTSHYWFKREHKFVLVNETRGEVAKAMIVNYGYYPLSITYSSDKYATTVTQVEVYETIVYENGSSEEILVGYEEVLGGFKKDVALSDGSVYAISENFSAFNTGKKVYWGFNDTKTALSYFLICDIERGAHFAWVE